MAHIWTRRGDEEWQPVALSGDACVLAASGPVPVVVPVPRPDCGRCCACVACVCDDVPFDGDPIAPDDSAGAVVLRRLANATDDRWALLTGPSAGPLVNGLSVPLGLVVLSDRDEIRLATSLDPPAAPLFFSTERLATTAAYPAGARRGSCPRCKQPLTAGELAVKCPGCGLWHHATEALPCWTYGEQCAACPQPTALDAGLLWTPEDL